MALAAACAAALAGPALAAKDDVVLISRATGPAGAPVTRPRSRPSISDAERVAFSSDANNLSADDDNGVANIFVRDLVANTTTLVSRASGSGARPRARPRSTRTSRATATGSSSGREPTTSRPTTTTASPTSSCATWSPTRPRWSAARPAPGARPRPILALAAAAAALLSAPALAAKDDVVLISRATGPAGTPVERQRDRALDLGERRPGRLQQRRRQHLGRGRQRRP